MDYDHIYQTFVGKKKVQPLDIRKGEGDKWIWSIFFDSGNCLEVFNPHEVYYENE